MGLAGVRVHAPGRLRVGVPAAGRLGVARPLLLLGLPVVADLLERMLDRGERGAVRPLALAVLLDCGVVGLGVGVLRLLRRPFQRARHVLASRHDNLLRTTTASDLRARSLPLQTASPEGRSPRRFWRTASSRRSPTALPSPGDPMPERWSPRDQSWGVCFWPASQPAT